MGFYENGLERIAALCVGSASIAFGALPDGAIEASVGLSGLAGFIMGRSQKFGPECGRVRRSIQNNLLKDYQNFIQSEGDDWILHADIEAADQALQECLGDCFIDREKLAKSAVTPLGFPGEAVLVVMKGLAEMRPDLFSDDKQDTLAVRYARDVIKSGITAAVENIDYYKQLEPQLMLEMAQTLGVLRADVKDIKQNTDTLPNIELSVSELKDDYRHEIRHLTCALHASETEMVALLGFILEKRVARDTLISEVENAYQKLTDLRESIGDLKSLSNEAPEILPLLEEADKALEQGKGFSLDKAEAALKRADQRYLEIIEEREEQVKRDKENRAKLLGKRAEIAAIQWHNAEVESLYREQSQLLEEALGTDHLDVATSYTKLASILDYSGKLEESELLLQKSLEIRRRVLGADHLDVATSYTKLAYNLLKQGKHDNAASLYKISLEIRKRALGGDHLDVAESYNDLAICLHWQERHSEAEPYIRKRLKIHERLLGENHAHVAIGYQNLAENLRAQGKHQQAKPLFVKSADIALRMRPLDTLKVAIGLVDQARVLRMEGKYDIAEPLLKMSLGTHERVLGAEHPDLEGIYHELARNLIGQGRYKESYEYMERSLPLLLTKRGPRDILYAASLLTKAEAESGLGWNNDALTTISEALKCLSATSSKDNVFFQEALDLKRRVETN